MKQTHWNIFIVIIMAFVFGFAGCQQEGTGEKAGKKIDQATEKAGKTMDQKTEKAEETMDDSAITAKIKAEILSDPLLKVSQISVTTTNNVVTLSGVVDSQQSIDRAMEIVHSIKSVKSVENNLAVK
jgi:hyperosmotically inducible protein